ncbi:hypothetical protein AFK24_02220 [Pseudomonas syringae]|uniref:Uncharacterized protein n=1 Tax=Pseudomonas syringae TaxID=317 RepID=A0A1C7ZDT4_PSESX|nr:hypothetical protein [Pseudomonas syringae]OCR26718.1 hypothetical protein AFK24_02220 [Pseudomonas syringae]
MNKFLFGKRALYMAAAFTLLGGMGNAVNVMAEQSEGDAGLIEQPLVLEDKLNGLNGYLNDNAEIKYFSFTAIRGQNVMFRDVRQSKTRSLGVAYEYKDGGLWKSLPGDGVRIFDNLQSGQEIIIRVFKRPNSNTVLRSYDFRFGSAPYHATADLIRSDAQGLPLYAGIFQAFREINWSIHIHDSTGHPLEGAKASIEVGVAKKIDLYTAANGRAAATIALPACEGSMVSRSFSTGNGTSQRWWNLRYNPGRLVAKLEDDDRGYQWNPGAIDSTFGHICKQWLLY